MTTRVAVNSLVIMLLLAPTGMAQMFVDDFNAPAGTLLTSLGWIAHRSAGVNPILVSATPLQYTGYPTSPLGGSAEIIGRTTEQGEDLHHVFPSHDSGSVFVSFLINVISAPTSGDYFLHLGPASLGNTYRAKICIRSPEPGLVEFAVAKSLFPDSTIAWTSTRYTLNSTHLVIMEYRFHAGGNADDTVALWIDPLLDSTAGTPDLIQTDSGIDAANIGNIVLRQGSTASRILFDGLRVGTRWAEAPLPVLISSFIAKVEDGHTVALEWRTETEIGSYGFYVYRALRETDQWSAVSPFIYGHGTTTVRQVYTYRDTVSDAGAVKYRLKQLDLDGGATWSETIVPSSPSHVALRQEIPLELKQSYPNPCNPTAHISFVALARERVVLNVYTLLGQHLGTLYQGWVEPGVAYDVPFDGSRLAAGPYIYTLQGAAWRISRKLILEK